MTDELRALIEEARSLAQETKPEAGALTKAIQRIQLIRAQCLRAGEKSQAWEMWELESELIARLSRARRTPLAQWWLGFCSLGQETFITLLEACPAIV